jgi:enoyl-CoA hydratase/carnithine racemase
MIKINAYEGVHFEVTDHVATITLARPKSLNAMDSNVHRAIISIIDEIDDTESVKVVVFKGEGRAFSTGSDLKEIGQLSGIAEQKYVELDFSTKNRVAGCKKPTIASIHGYCLGGGLELALACDIRIAANNAIFGFPEVGLGSLPGSGGLQRLPEVVGRGVAKEWILTARRIDAEEAFFRGLITQNVPIEELSEATNALAKNMSRFSPLAVRLAKVALTPEPISHNSLVGAFQMLAGDACHSQASYAEATQKFSDS